MHDTGYFSALPSLEEYWQQVTAALLFSVNADFDRSNARSRKTRSLEVARNARLFLENLLALTGVRTCECNVVYAAPRSGSEIIILLASLEELLEQMFLISLGVHSARHS